MRWVALLAAFTPTVAFTQWHLPLDVRNHRSASLAFLRLTPRSHTAAFGEEVFSYSLVGANEFRRTGPVDEDAETWRLDFAYGKGIAEKTELFVELPLVARGGGFMDAMIEWWHGNVISQPDPIRSSTPKGRSSISFPGGDFGDAIGLGDLTVGLARRIDDKAIVRAAIKAPTGDASKLLGSGGFDVALATDYRLLITDDLSLDLNGGVTFQGSATNIDNSRRQVFFSALSLTYEQTSRDAWTIQLNSEGYPSATGTTTLDKDHRVLSFGYQRRLDDSTILQLYFSEDGDFLHFPGGPTLGPDFTVGARLVQFR